MFELKSQLTVNMNISLECAHGTTKEDAEKELDKILDSVTMLTDHRVIFSQYETSEMKEVTSI